MLPIRMRSVTSGYDSSHDRNGLGREYNVYLFTASGHSSAGQWTDAVAAVRGLNEIRNSLLQTFFSLEGSVSLHPFFFLIV